MNLYSEIMQLIETKFSEFMQLIETKNLDLYGTVVCIRQKVIFIITIASTTLFVVLNLSQT